MQTEVRVHFVLIVGLIVNVNLFIKLITFSFYSLSFAIIMQMKKLQRHECMFFVTIKYSFAKTYVKMSQIARIRVIRSFANQ